MNYLSKIKSLQRDDPESVIKMLKEYINDETLVPEQKLFAIGVIVNANKEDYIKDLKTKVKQYECTIKQLRENLVKKSEPLKRKIVVVRKKDV